MVLFFAWQLVKQKKLPLQKHIKQKPKLIVWAMITSMSPVTPTMHAFTNWKMG